MFGIGLPEMLVILAVALIVVGPDKLPGLARSLAKGLTEMKKSLDQVKESLTQEDETLRTIKDDLRTTAEELRTGLTGPDLTEWKTAVGSTAQDNREQIIDVEPEARAIEAELRGQDDDAAEVAAAEVAARSESVV
jgi:sec-independent protein translocase protein TatB